MKKNSTIIFDNDLPISKIFKQIGKSKKIKINHYWRKKF